MRDRLLPKPEKPALLVRLPADVGGVVVLVFRAVVGC